MVFQLVSKELTDPSPVGTGAELLEQRSERAVVLVLHIASDAYRIPLVEQMPQVVFGGVP